MTENYSTIRQKIEEAYSIGILTEDEYRNKLEQIEQSMEQDVKNDSVTDEIIQEELQYPEVTESAVDLKTDNTNTEKQDIEDDGIVYFDQLVDQKQSESITYVKGVEEQRKTPRKMMPKEIKPKRSKKKIGCVVVCAVLLIPILFFVFVLNLGGRDYDIPEDKPVSIVWEDLKLGSMLPEPPVLTGNVDINKENELNVVVFPFPTDQLIKYMDDCVENGFSVDVYEPYESGSVVNAFDTNGYKLYLEKYGSDDNKLRVHIYPPIKMNTIRWPNVGIGGDLPKPKSDLGRIENESSDTFDAYIGDTSKKQYDEYVNECIDDGYSVDYDRDDRYFSAENKRGDSLSVEYYGNNIMEIDVYNWDLD